MANSAGLDAAKRQMRKSGRKAMSADDFDRAARVTQGILVDLGFDVASWQATAGVPRNEPDPPPRKKPKRRSAKKPVQLSFSFA